MAASVRKGKGKKRRENRKGERKVNYTVGQKDYSQYLPKEVQAIVADHPAITITYSTAFKIDWRYSEAADDAGRAEVVDQVARVLDAVDEILRETDEYWEDATPRWAEARLARMDLNSKWLEKTYGGITVRGSGWQTEYGDDAGFQPSVRIRWHAWADKNTETPVSLAVRQQDTRRPVYAPRGLDTKVCLYETMVTPLMREWHEPCIEYTFYDSWFDCLDEHVYDDNNGDREYYELWTPEQVYIEFLVRCEMDLQSWHGIAPFALQLREWSPSRDWLMEKFDIGYIDSCIPYASTWW